MAPGSHYGFPTHVGNLGRAVMLLAPYDALFFHEPHLVDRFRAMLDLPVTTFPRAATRGTTGPRSRPAPSRTSSSPGTCIPAGLRLLERLTAKGIPVKVYGSGIPRWIGESPVRHMHAGRPVFAEEKARIFRSAAGVLNNLHPAEVGV